MPREQSEYDEQYTVDPDLFESDRVVGPAAVYQEEAGVQKATSGNAGLVPCQFCGRPVVHGRLSNGTFVAVEVDQPTYTILWVNRKSVPTFTLSRAYVGHQCQGPVEGSVKERKYPPVTPLIMTQPRPPKDERSVEERQAAVMEQLLYGKNKE